MTEGKTKKIHQIAGSADMVTLISEDDITAGDSASFDIIAGKSALANATTCNTCFACSRPAAFRSRSRSRTARPRSSRRTAGCTMRW